MLSPVEILLLVLVGFLLFGVKKLPMLGKGLGGGIREFRKELQNDKNDQASQDDQNDQNDHEQKRG